MKVLITGKNGQVGINLAKSVPKGVELFKFGHPDLDITSQEALSEQIHEIEPDYIINAAGYTAVDRLKPRPKRLMP